LELASLAVAAMLLMMPIVEYYHYTLAVLPLIALFGQKGNFIATAAIAVSVVLIEVCYVFTDSFYSMNLPLSNAGLLLAVAVLWCAVARTMLSRCTLSSRHQSGS
jgi:hypothetical protein